MGALISKQIDPKAAKLHMGNHTMKDLNLKGAYHTQGRQS